MTICVVKINKENIEIVTDSRISSWSGRREDLQALEVMKSEKINNDLYVAIAGWPSTIDYIKLYLEKDPSVLSKKTGKSSVLKFMIGFVHFLKESIPNSSPDQLLPDFHIIIVYHNMCFKYYSGGGSLIDIKNFSAIGSGSSFALTALHLGKSATEAVKIACKLDAYCDLPVRKKIIKK